MYLAGYWISVFVSAPMQNTCHRIKIFHFISQVRYEIYIFIVYWKYST